ncbi:MAG: glutamate 5-kinase [Succinivibrio sp.]
MSQTKKRRVVIKLGTSTLTNGSKNLDRAHMLEIVRTVALLREKNVEVILVSSGAIAAGREYLGNPDLPKEMCYKQMLASVGQVKLIEEWDKLFSIYKINIGQILITRADLEIRERYLNARDTLFAMLEMGVVPVINENDAVAVSEIKVGDNDNLASLSAVLTEADMVILLTDQKGLYTADPRKNKDASLIRTVEKIDEHIIEIAGGSGTTLGTGGMATKIIAAKTATDAGVEMVIASGEDPSLILDLVKEKGDATFFKPSVKPVLARKSWIGTATKASGVITVDAGAARAIKEKGSSLLPKGITKVEEEFLRGATVLVEDPNGNVVGRGLTRYSSEELMLILGKKSSEIVKTLGYTHGDVAIHRDDFVLVTK